MSLVEDRPMPEGCEVAAFVDAEAQSVVALVEGAYESSPSEVAKALALLHFVRTGGAAGQVAGTALELQFIAENCGECAGSRSCVVGRALLGLG
jgi:hypothetical protein